MVVTRDVDMMERVRSGDNTAFGEIVDQHKDALLNYLTRFCGSRSRAEDLAQETFLKLYLHKNTYIEDGKLRSYLYRIATNLAINAHRKDRRWRIFELISRSSRNGDSPGPSPQSQVLLSEAQKKLTAAIADLPLAFRAPLVLHEIEELPYAEVAQILNCNEGTVKSRISRGRQRLKQKLTPYFNGGTA
ncbi:MAG: RNA polymerase sigma factor [Myxococcota bacterium]|nr:RNA polymerase sigma factor [Myxococcota bacterium]